MQRSLAGNSSTQGYSGLSGTSAEVRQWLCAQMRTSWRPATPTEVIEAWPGLLRKIRLPPNQRATTLPDNPYRPMLHLDTLPHACAPCPLLRPPSLQLATLHTAAHVRTVRQGYLDNCRSLLEGAYDALQGAKHLALIDAFRYLKVEAMELAEVAPFLLRELASWHPHMPASATSASLVEVCEFWAVHCTGQKATGHGPHGPDAARLLLLKEGPASSLLRFGTRRPSMVDLLVFTPGQTFVQVGRLGYDHRTNALQPMVASVAVSYTHLRAHET